ncbi:MAG: efflux RND transporter periplasmic adaptor subunit [Phycisphaerales bacterium JB040]
MRERLVALVCGIVGATSAVSVAQQGGPPPANVRLGEVRLETLAERREVTGDVGARLRATLAGQQPGLVVSLTVEGGDRVEQGQVLARLDDVVAQREAERARAMVESARAVVARREAELAEAENDLGRARELDAQGSSSVGELEAAQTMVQVARAQLQEARAEVLSAEADLGVAEKRLADMTIRAPFAGSVVSKRTEVGEWLGLGDPVVELVADDLLEALIDVPESVVGRLQVDDPVSVTVRALESQIEGRIIGVLPEADELSRLFRVRIEIPAYVGELHVRPGMSVTAQIPTSRTRDVLTLPKDAVMRGPTGEHVFYDAGGVSGLAPILVLFATGDRVAVRSEALEAGVSVVVQGNERMFPGQPLNVLPDRVTADGGATPGDPGRGG